MGLLPTIRSRCVGLPLVVPERAASLAWLTQAGVPDAADWLAFAGGAPLLARDYADSERGRLIGQLTGLVRTGGKDALAAWPAGDREHIEALAEVLQKWAYDQVTAGFGAAGNFFGAAGSNKPRSVEKSREWIRFALRAGQYRLATKHPLNPRLFALDLISSMPD